MSWAGEVASHMHRSHNQFLCHSRSLTHLAVSSVGSYRRDRSVLCHPFTAGRIEIYALLFPPCTYFAKNLLSDEDIGAEVSQISQLLRFIPNAFGDDLISLPPRECVIILARNKREIDILKVIVLADAPNLEQVALFFPVEAKQTTVRVIHDWFKTRPASNVGWEKYFKSSSSHIWKSKICSNDFSFFLPDMRMSYFTYLGSFLSFLSP